MARYENKILNALLDSYESSLLSRGENKVSIHIAYPFSKRNLPEYFNESTLDYEDVHACVKELERKNYIKIVWKRGKENHIIEKVILNELSVQDIYACLKRVPKIENETAAMELLLRLQNEYDASVTYASRTSAPVTKAFIEYLVSRLKEGKTVKEYIDIAELSQIEQLVKAVFCVETNEDSCYIREFSIHHFQDSKIFNCLFGKIFKVWNTFCPDEEYEDIDALLAEHLIYNTPNYIYIKGCGILERNSKRIDLEEFVQGIGISGEDIAVLNVRGKRATKHVITIENLTTFFSWKEPDSLIIYLGGYHNSLRRQLLGKIYEQMPDVEYLHFGDIDVGGFEIYENLCKKTGIPFRTYHMGVEELERYGVYAKELTENDRKRLDKLILFAEEKHRKYVDVLQYMKKNGVKLEQECIVNENMFD